MNMQLDSDYLQRNLKVLADDMKSDEPDVAKAYLFIQHRLNQSFPDGDVSRQDIEDILHEPQGRKHLQNMPEWAIDHLFESKLTRKKIIKESKLANLINRIINEEVRKVRLHEDRFVDGTHPTRKAYWTYLESLPKEQLMRIAQSKQRISSIDKTTPKQDLISHIVFSEFSKDVTKPIKLPAYAEKFLPKFMPKESRIKESSSQQEIDDIALNLIDSFGEDLEFKDWKDRRIVEFFKDSGITDQNLMKTIYNRALQLNRE